MKNNVQKVVYNQLQIKTYTIVLSIEKLLEKHISKAYQMLRLDSITSRHLTSRLGQKYLQHLWLKIKTMVLRHMETTRWQRQTKELTPL